MGQAVFTARDPAGNTRADLESLLPTLHAVTHWNVEPSGRVTIEYDEQAGSVEVIEEALAGLGFEVQHNADDPDAGNVAGVTATTRGAHGPNLRMGEAENPKTIEER